MINLAIMRLRPNAKWQMTNNSYDELVWLDEEQSKPTKKEVDDEILQLIIEQELQIKINEALRYLGDTDFYYPRYLETGEPVPTDVVMKRQEYRTFLRENENVR